MLDQSRNERAQLPIDQPPANVFFAALIAPAHHARHRAVEIHRPARRIDQRDSVLGQVRHALENALGQCGYCVTTSGGIHAIVLRMIRGLIRALAGELRRAEIAQANPFQRKRAAAAARDDREVEKILADVYPYDCGAGIEPDSADFAW